ncbi:MAG: Crp/Fnr family transcriptional regulator [Terriglobales bacterium]
MRLRTGKTLDFRMFLARHDSREVRQFRRNEIIFSQGDRNDSLFYIEKGAVKLTVSSDQGKEAVIGILDGGDFFGESCVVGQRVRSYTAVALTDLCVARMKREDAVRVLQTNAAIAYSFIARVLQNYARIQEDLAENLLYSTERRLARALLLLTDLQDKGELQPGVRVSQQTLAEMVGTTRQRVNILMGRFRKQGLVRYGGGLKVRRSILNASRKR